MVDRGNADCKPAIRGTFPSGTRPGIEDASGWAYTRGPWVRLESGQSTCTDDPTQEESVARRLRIASWNLGGAKHRGSNPYRAAAAQRLSWEALLDQGPHVILVQEAVFAAFELPAGWRQSRGEAPQGWGSIIAVGPDIEFDADWRPLSPALAAYGSYLALGRVRPSQSDWIHVVSVHAPEDRLGWEAAGGQGPRPQGSVRPWSSEAPMSRGMVRRPGCGPGSRGVAA